MMLIISFYPFQLIKSTTHCASFPLVTDDLILHFVIILVVFTFVSSPLLSSFPISGCQSLNMIDYHHQVVWSGRLLSQ